LQASLGSNDTRTIDARGTSGDCTIPDDALGLSLNVTAVDASANTHLTIWSDGGRPTSSSLNPSHGDVAFNAVVTRLSGSGTFNVYNLAGGWSTS
jgi:hypothetical protein